jgi:hypothetical protein
MSLNEQISKTDIFNIVSIVCHPWKYHICAAEVKAFEEATANTPSDNEQVDDIVKSHFN